VIPLISKRYSYFHLELITFFNFESTSNKLHIAVLTRTVLNIYEAIGKQSIYSFFVHVRRITNNCSIQLYKY